MIVNLGSAELSEPLRIGRETAVHMGDHLRHSRLKSKVCGINGGSDRFPDFVLKFFEKDGIKKRVSKGSVMEMSAG